MTWLLNLGFAGGEGAEVFVLNTLYVEAENTTLYVRDDNDMMIVYMHGKTGTQTTGLKKIKVDWTKWLDGSTISTSAWTVDDTTLTLSNESNSTTSATVYIAPTPLNEEYWLENTITTADSVPRIESRSIRVKMVRMV